MNGIETTVVGNLGRDIELRFSQAGRPWTRFSIAVSRVTRDASGEKKENTSWVNCKIFGDQAENLAASAQKGIRVLAVGHFETEEWNDQNGDKKSEMVFIIDEIGPSLRWATTVITRTPSNGNGGSFNGGGNSGGNARAKASVSSDNGNGFAADLSDEENPFL